jgi:hypothetical protein
MPILGALTTQSDAEPLGEILDLVAFGVRPSKRPSIDPEPGCGPRLGPRDPAANRKRALRQRRDRLSVRYP